MMVVISNLKPNTSAHLNPTSWGFKQFSRRLFSWQSMIDLLLLDKLAKKNHKNCVIISQNCKKELRKYVFTDLINFGK